MTLIRRPTTLFGRAPEWWWSAVILAPLILLAILGARGIRADRESTQNRARADSLRAIEEASRLFLQEKLPALRYTLHTYPIVPQPTDPTEAERLYHLATSSAHDEAGILFAKLTSEHRNDTTSAGLPVVPLVEWTQLQRATEPAEIAKRVESLARSAVETHPSILSSELLNRAAAIAAEHNVQSDALIQSQKQWAEHEVIRALLRQHQASGNSPQATWLANETSRWWIEPIGASGDWSVMKQDELVQAAGALAKDLSRQLPDSIALSFHLYGIDLVPRPEHATILAERSTGTFTVAAWIADPSTLYHQQRRQAFWLASLLGLALITVLGAFYFMQRALFTERELNNQKSDFVASVSHELRAPVASMRLMLENLETGAVKGRSSEQEYLRLIGGECRRLSTLIENVLDFARIEHNRKSYHMAEADVPALINDAVQLLQPRAAQRRQELCTALDPIEPVPRIDAIAIQQALINLIDNAIKFSPEQTKITISAGSLNGRAWRLSVADQGPGIPAAERERVFERFYRIGSELRRETQGSGIGLSIVKHTVEAHGGQIEVDSQPGAGARFTLTLPYSNSDDDSR